MLVVGRTNRRSMAVTRAEQDPAHQCRYFRWAVPWELAALVFPLASIVYAAAGFLFGLPVGRWQGVCGLATAILLSLVGAGTRVRKARKLATVLGLITGSVMLASASVMYSTADAEAYHRPASMLMAAGWNPVFDSTVESVEALRMPDESMRVWHVAYLPRAFWIFNAVLYKTVGCVEAGDALNVLLCVLSYQMVSRLLARVLGMTGTTRRVAAVLVTMSPTVVALLFGGMCDGGFYSLFVIAVVAATLYAKTGGMQWAWCVGATFPMLANLKFTGVVCCGVISAVFFVACVKAWRSNGVGLQMVARWLQVIAASIGVAAVIGFSPYVTSWARYGGPFYPAHSFDARQPLANNLTADFLSMNKDAERMGYAGRFAYAYLSQSLTLSLYGEGAEGGRFSPRFDVSGGVGGFGPVFRGAFILSLMLLPFIRLRNLGWLLSCIMLTVLLQPPMYVGYARYVSQFYAFPLLVFFAAARQLHVWLPRIAQVGTGVARGAKIVVPATVCLSALCYSVPLLAYPLSLLGLQWVIAVQNLEIMKALSEDPAPIVRANTYYSRHALREEYDFDGIRFLAGDDNSETLTEGRFPYSSYFSFYTYFAPRELENVPVLNHTVSRNDQAIIASRNRRNTEFFVFTFLPRQVPRIPGYLRDVAIMRCRQLWRVWFGAAGSHTGICANESS